jgi:hypothetical protein
VAAVVGNTSVGGGHHGLAIVNGGHRDRWLHKWRCVPRGTLCIYFWVINYLTRPLSFDTFSSSIASDVCEDDDGKRT